MTVVNPLLRKIIEQVPNALTVVMVALLAVGLLMCVTGNGGL